MSVSGLAAVTAAAGALIALPAAAAADPPVGNLSVSQSVPSDVSAQGPVTLAGTITNNDAVNPGPDVQVQVAIETVGVSPALDDTMLSPTTCDVGATTGGSAAVTLSGTVITLSCPTTTGAIDPSGTVNFAFHVQLFAAATATGTLSVTTSVVTTTTTEATAGPDTITVHHAPSLSSIDVPSSVGTTDVTKTFHVTLHNDLDPDTSTGAAYPTTRLYLSLTDASGMSSLVPAQAHLTCGLDPQTPTAITLVSADPGPPASWLAACDDFALGSGDVDTFTFTIGFDNAAPSGQLSLRLFLDVVDSGSSRVPSLASTPAATVAVFSPPAPVPTLSAPAALATGADPTPFTLQVDNGGDGHDFTDVKTAIAMTLPGLVASQVTVTCDTGSGASTAGKAVSGSSIIATCPDADDLAVPHGTTAKIVHLTIALGLGAPTGSLSWTATLLDNANGDAVLNTDATQPPTPVVTGAPKCQTGTTFVWTGASGAAWTDATSWDRNAVPGASDSVTLPAGASATGVTGSVCNLRLNGGADANHRTRLAGTALDVLGDATFTDFDELAASVTVEHVLTTAASTNLQLTDASAGLIVPAGKAATLGAGTGIHRPANATGANPVFSVAGTLSLAGAVTLDDIGLALAGTGQIDTHSSTLTLLGPSTSTWQDGATVLDGGSGGAVNVAGGAAVVVPGSVHVTAPATLRLAAADAAITGSTSASTLAGTGTFSWQLGDVTGQLSLALPTKLDSGVTAATSATRGIPAGTVVTNTGSFDFTGPSAALGLDGTLINNGSTMTLRAGTALRGSGLLSNNTGKTLTLAASTGSAVLTGVSLHNAGTLTLPSGMALQLAGDAALPGTGLDSQLYDGSALAGGGTLLDSGRAQLTLHGTITFSPGSDLTTSSTTFKQPAVLELDDAGTGTGVLVGDPAQPVKLTGTNVTDGVLLLCSGLTRGVVTVDKITTEVGTGVYGARCGTAGSPVPLLGGDSGSRAVLTANGPATITSAKLTLQPHALLQLGGATVLSGSAGIDHTADPVTDENAVVTATGTLTVQALNLTRPDGTQSGSTRGVVNVPFTNHGVVFVTGAPLDLNSSVDTDGSACLPAPLSSICGFNVNGTTVNVPNAAFTNEGIVTVQAASATSPAKLNVPKGYTQTASTGLPKPITGVFANSTLSTNDGAGQLAPVSIDGGGSQGGVGGDGTIEASTVTITDGWIHPGTSVNAGTMLIKGQLVLTSTSDVQVVIRPPTSGSTPAHDVLKVTGAATLSGQITGITLSGYAPAYLTVVKDVFDFTSHTGNFTKTSWSGTPTGLGWKPTALTSTAKQVDLQLVDVAPPSLGIASIPAFTEFTSQRVTYDAVDNRTGLKSFDVRWQSGNPTHAFSAWHYPATWQHTTATHQTLTGLAMGWEYCFSMRARDNVGNTTPWSKPLCATRMFDDQALAAHGPWKRPTSKTGFYRQTYSQSSRLGATLTKNSGTFTRVGVIAYACPKCGVLGIYSGKTLLKKWSLKASRARLVNWISPLLTARKAVLTLKVMSGRKQVLVDAVGLTR